ncbi:MAG: chorismate mutase [Chloroflexi bacterium]|nr:chorismate mutase [Chloroflexota bacterium]
MSIVCRGIRGATTAENTPESILSATREMLEAILSANDLKKEQIVAAFFTATQDLNAAFPATAARVQLGWTEVALLDSRHMDVPGSLSHCIRVLVLANTDRPAQDLVNVYLRGAANLRSTTGNDNLGR